MIVPKRAQDESAVAGHYDVLDSYYREIWGEHVHHGLWVRGDETVEEATRALTDAVADRAGIEAGDAVCDVGCGYGATSRMLATERGAQVTGFTLSRAQAAWAEAHAPGTNAPDIRVGSWLDNGLEPESCDAVIAIESISHMEDKARVFGECARVLRPGGRLVVCDWLAPERRRPWQERLLLEPICREGRLPGMGTPSEYEALMGAAGLEVESFRDESRSVQRTWSICIRRALRRLATDRDARSFLLSRRNPDRAFALTMLRLPVAYRTGSMLYGIHVASKPGA